MIRKSRRDKLLDVFPGPPRPPIIGHSFDFLFTPKERKCVQLCLSHEYELILCLFCFPEIFPMLLRWCEQYGPVIKTFSGGLRFLMVWEPKYVEVRSRDGVAKLKSKTVRCLNA